jgi:molybdopterin synthase catalytic subunit
MKADIKLSKKVLIPGECLQFVENDSAGGHVLFVGTVRNRTAGKQVIRLEFEAYEPMAIKEISKICDVIFKKWPEIIAVSIHHRTGILEIGDIPVVIAVSAPHRDRAFQACQFAIDTLKQTVPIWKKEIFESGEVWVAAHP